MAIHLQIYAFPMNVLKNNKNKQNVLKREMCLKLMTNQNYSIVSVSKIQGRCLQWSRNNFRERFCQRNNSRACVHFTPNKQIVYADPTEGSSRYTKWPN